MSVRHTDPMEVRLMDKKDGSQKVGMGVGYVSVMLIFAVICLTIFAVLSFKAAISTDSYNERSGEFMQQYYAADTSAKETLSKLNDCAFEAAKSDFFEDEFTKAVQNMDGVSAKKVQQGISVSYSASINQQQKLLVEILFDENGKYKIEQWQSRNIFEENSDSHLNVWDGTF